MRGWGLDWMIDAVKTGVQSLRRKTASMEDSLLAMENGYYMMDMVTVFNMIFFRGSSSGG